MSNTIKTSDNYIEYVFHMYLLVIFYYGKTGCIARKIEHMDGHE